MFDMIDSNSKKGLAGELYSLLGDSFTMSFRAQACHWNVRGEDFTQFHNFFAMIYGDVEGAIDPTAENIRKLGFDAPLNLSDMVATTMIRDETFTSNPIDMVSALLAANDVIIARINSAFAAATDCNEQGICNFLADRDGQHKKWAWQMKSILGIDGQQLPGKSEADFLLEAPEFVSVEDQHGNVEIETFDLADQNIPSTGEHGLEEIPARAAYRAGEVRRFRLSNRTELALIEKAAEYNKTAPVGRRTTPTQLMAVYRRAATSFTAASSMKFSRDQSAMARIDAYLSLLRTGTAKNRSYTQDNDLLPANHPKSMEKNAITAAVSELTVTLKNPAEYESVEEAIVALAEFSGQGYEIIPALRATWKRAVNTDEKAFDRTFELATRLYDSKDNDLLPRRD